MKLPNHFIPLLLLKVFPVAFHIPLVLLATTYLFRLLFFIRKVK